MTAIPFPATSAPGRKKQETGGRLINCHVREAEGVAAGQVLWERSPGLRRIIEIPDNSGCRGLIDIGSVLINVLAERVYAVTLSSGGTWSAQNLGPLAGSAPVTIAQNNASPTPNTVCVTENGTFNLYSNAAPDAFADGNLPTANSVAMLNGYLIFSTVGGVLWATDLNSVSVASNSFERAGRNLLRVVRYNDEILAFGPDFLRVYRDEGLSPFPLAYAPGTQQGIGIVGTHAVAGHGEGWSEALIFAANDNRVYRREGYGNAPISTPDVSRAIEKAADRSLLQAVVYMSEGRPVWSLTSPGEWTWDYDLATGLWNERASYGRSDWRGRRTIRMFDRWIVGDAITGDLAEMVAGLGFEHDAPLVYELYSGIISAFPQRINAVRSWFRFTAGVGVAAGDVPIETEPRVEISWSRDGGATFGNPLLRELGSEGDFDKLVSIGPTGFSSSKGLQYRLRISDPVHASFMGGEAAFEQIPA